MIQPKTGCRQCLGFQAPSVIVSTQHAVLADSVKVARPGTSERLVADPTVLEGLANLWPDAIAGTCALAHRVPCILA